MTTSTHSHCSRRAFLAQSASVLGAVSCSALWADTGQKSRFPMPFFPNGDYQKLNSTSRRYHLSVGSPTVLNHPELYGCWKEAGVTDLWLTALVYGNLPNFDEINQAVRITRELGMTPHLISMPLGHPVVFGSDTRVFNPAYKPVERASGYKGWGASCHNPADEINIDENRKLFEQFGPCNHFLDDDFRLADSPGSMGGCVCPECKKEYCRIMGFSDERWNELLDNLRNNNDTPLLRQWCDYQCDLLYDLFRRCEEAAPEMDLGIMVMYMGSERAGIRLPSYRDKLFRVGEMMFSDEAYNQTVNKTRELFSVLMHRRFSLPGRSFSETTNYPDGALCKENMASKLATSTFADVRNTMFMCDNPADYWPYYTPKMKKERRYQEILKNHPAKGPFKHFWGIAGRYLIGEISYSLFLATGVPFEVCSELSDNGWTFLGDNDARSLERGEIASPGTKCFAWTASETGRFDKLDETFESLFAFRRSILPQLKEAKIPYIEEEVPIVLGWYPDANAVLLWNVERTAVTVHLRRGENVSAVEIPALETALAQEQTDGRWQFI